MVNGNNLNNIRYADDAMLLANSIEKLQLLLDTVVEKSAGYGPGLGIDTQKSKEIFDIR